MSKAGWIGVDLDRTLAVYDTYKGPTEVGPPIPEMVERVKAWRQKGIPVKVMTARVSQTEINDETIQETIDLAALHGEQLSVEQAIENIQAWNKSTSEVEKAIQDWTETHIGERLPVTCMKDFMMIELWDDRAVQVEPNTGKVLQEELDELKRYVAYRESQAPLRAMEA